jgi:hypothetical protein
MGSSERLEFVTRRSVEEAYRRAKQAQISRRQSMADIGLRAARARDPKLLRTLEEATEILRQMSEEQLGVHGMEVGGSLRVEATEYQMWREAYRMADEDRGIDALRPFEWIYAGAAWLCGLAL